MLDRLGEMLSLGFMQRALLGGVIVGATCAFLSVFVVLRRMAFVSQGISHAAFGGVALAVLLGLNPTWGAMVFAVGTGLAVGVVSHRGRVAEDSTIGIFLAVAMALGIIFLGLKEGSTANLFGYLFGSILSILPQDLLWMAALAGIVFFTLLAFAKELYFYVFDEGMARVSGIPVDRLYFGLLGLLAVTIVVSLKLVGVILVTALLVIPAAAVRLITNNVVLLVVGSVSVGVASVLVGLTVAYLLDVSPGASIVLVLFLFFLVSFIAPGRRR
jgi:ABC-type Mn2+/Zn2+ transport system permease subunit